MRIGFLIFPGFPMACLTSVIEPLRAANEIGGRDVFEWSLVSETGGRTTSSAGVAFDPDLALADLDTIDLLFVLAAPISQFADARAGNGALRRLDRHGAILGAVSGGVFPLVRSGVMAGHRCSVHWCYEAAFRSEFPTIGMTDDVITMDRRRYTVSGAASAFDLALCLIRARLDGDIAHEVACWFQHATAPGERVQQRVPMQPEASPEVPSLVARATAMFADRIEDPISVAEVASTLGVTPRQVERAFKKATGQSPTHYYREMRMKAARQLVLYSNDPVLKIAQAVGYTSSTPLMSHYREAFGVTPQVDRQRINASRLRGNVPLPSA
ncbi:Transcriptional regulator GlxA family, contains an amidase domain and an AraC-type DNA-binding HTH domain [Poseidonocella sedimentorum]|uniref:Transcriptional regulator GlxA family, contains an amidase domain and an AraC-type DNA-binding HTH domain n=2 Tax=Poseidonocella sedimentorum TaxID=871652 RepID=A0A1I6DKM5_9RHOB|nr:Transcriptional regulator GlxA family, contains an amidase domain and an AraC-type DNA-binding HTH domain [Poseidonocella sedimentorum]